MFLFNQYSIQCSCQYFNFVSVEKMPISNIYSALKRALTYAITKFQVRPSF